MKGVSVNTSLVEMGMDSMMAVEIKQMLEREFEIFLTAQDIRTLNFAKLQELNAAFEKGDTNDSSKKQEVAGANLLIRLIGVNDISDETCLKLSTQADSKKDPIFFIPGLEGLSSVFSVLASKIKAPGLCLQPGFDSSKQKSFSAVADLFVPVNI